MSWRIVYASEVGTSHTFSEIPCQDSCWGNVELLPNKQPLLSIFVADGAGSAEKGGEGAELAIEAAAKFVAKKIKQGEFGLNDKLATELIMAVRAHIFLFAEFTNLKARDYACTFLGILSSPLGTIALQIGDGGIVLDIGNGLEVAVEPMSGEYANMTNFITDDDAIAAFVSKSYPDPALRVAVFSDGIQRLALNIAKNIPHEPFFNPFFNNLKKISNEQENMLHPLLVNFLRSQAVNERTDDDKSLAIAVWIS